MMTALKTRDARRRRRPGSSGGGEILRGLGLLAVSLLLCEILLSAAARRLPALAYELSPPWSRALIPDPVLGHRLSPYYPGHDRRGYRNDGAGERYDVLAVGDSLTYGFAAAPEDSWPRRLERLSGLSTYNAGVGGYSPCEYAVVTRELLGLAPRVVLVGLFVGNDLGDAYRAAYVDRRCAARRSRDPEVLAAIAREDARGTLRQRAVALGMDVHRPAAGARGAPRRWLAERSSLYGLARSAIHRLSARRSSPLRALGVDSFTDAAGRPHRVTYDERPELRTVFLGPPLESLAVDLGDVRIREGLRITGDVLGGLRRELEERGIRLLAVVLHPKSAVYADLLRAAPAPRDAELDALLAAQERLAEDLREALTRRGVDSIDTLAPMRAALGGGEALFPQSDDEHPGAAGYRVIAETVATALPELR